MGYETANALGELQGGADDFPHMAAFFGMLDLSLEQCVPRDDLCGADPAAVKCMSCRQGDLWLVYAANANGTRPDLADMQTTAATADLVLTPRANVMVQHFDPRTGVLGGPEAATAVESGLLALQAPNAGDALFVVHVLPAAITTASPTSTSVTDYNVEFRLANCVDGKLLGSGLDYMGTMSFSQTGLRCRSWAALGADTMWTHLDLDQGHNYCRNPDDDNAPWCFTENTGGLGVPQWEYCNVCVDERKLMCQLLQPLLENTQCACTHLSSQCAACDPAGCAACTGNYSLLMDTRRCVRECPNNTVPDILPVGPMTLKVCFPESLGGPSTAATTTTVAPATGATTTAIPQPTTTATPAVPTTTTTTTAVPQPTTTTPAIPTTAAALAVPTTTTATRAVPTTTTAAPTVPTTTKAPATAPPTTTTGMLTTPGAPTSNITVVAFTVVNAATGNPLPGLDHVTADQTINLQGMQADGVSVAAVTEPVIVGSVLFVLNNVPVRTENGAPYSIAGDSGGVFRPWNPVLNMGYTLSATPFTERGASGDRGVSLTVRLTFIDTSMAATTTQHTPAPTTQPAAPTTSAAKTTAVAEPTTTAIPPTTTTVVAAPTTSLPPTTTKAAGVKVVSFTLINADLDQPAAGQGKWTAANSNTVIVINVQDLGATNVNVLAVTEPAMVARVVFELDGVKFNAERGLPYAMAGDRQSGLDYNAWVPELDREYELRAVPYAFDGSMGTALVVRVRFVDETTPSVTTVSPTTTAIDDVGITVESLTLINADVSQPVAAYPAWTQANAAPSVIEVDLRTIGTHNVNFVALTSPGIVGEVRFYVDNQLVRKEASLPYSLAGDRQSGLIYNAWVPLVMDRIYEITAVPFAGNGDRGVPLTLLLHFVDNGGGSGDGTTAPPAVATTVPPTVVTTTTLPTSPTTTTEPPTTTAPPTTTVPLLGPRVDSLTVLDAVTGQTLPGWEAVRMPKTDGEVLRVVLPMGVETVSMLANTVPIVVGSVEFIINSARFNVENGWPYSLAGDQGGETFVGWQPELHTLYNVTVIPYSGRRLAGDVGHMLSVMMEFSVATTPSVTTTSPTSTTTMSPTTTQIEDPDLRVDSVTLINADTNQPVFAYPSWTELDTGRTIRVDLHRVGTHNINFLILTSPALVGSVQFKLDGRFVHVDHGFPYTFAGDRNSGTDFLAWVPPVLNKVYTVTCTAFSANSQRGQPFHLAIEFVDSLGLETTASPTTASPTTASPTTASPTTASPTTNVPLADAWVHSFLLINADTNFPVPGFEEMRFNASASGANATDNVFEIDVRQVGSRRVAIVANVVPSVISSVVFELDGTVIKVEFGFPYAMYGNEGATFTPWEPALNQVYTIRATPLELVDNALVAGTPLSMRMRFYESTTTALPTTVLPDFEASVASFLLLDTNSSLPVPGYEEPASPGDAIVVIDLAMVNAPNITLVANVLPAQVGSVVILLNGAVFQVENGFPYALRGNSGLAFVPFEPELDVVYNVTATPFESLRGVGRTGQSKTLLVKFVRTPTTVAATTKAPTSIGQPTTTMNKPATTTDAASATTKAAATTAATTTAPSDQVRVVSLTLINADTDTMVTTWTAADTARGIEINFLELGTRNVNFLAVTNPAAVGKVEFYLDGVMVHSERGLPYSFAGDRFSGADFNPWTPDELNRVYVLSARPIGSDSQPGVPLTLNLTFTEQQVGSGDTTTAAAVTTSNAGTTTTVKAAATTTSTPVPVTTANDVTTTAKAGESTTIHTTHGATTTQMATATFGPTTTTDARPDTTAAVEPTTPNDPGTTTAAAQITTNAPPPDTATGAPADTSSTAHAEATTTVPEIATTEGTIAVSETTHKPTSVASDTTTERVTTAEPTEMPTTEATAATTLPEQETTEATMETTAAATVETTAEATMDTTTEAIMETTAEATAEPSTSASSKPTTSTVNPTTTTPDDEVVTTESAAVPTATTVAMTSTTEELATNEPTTVGVLAPLRQPAAEVNASVRGGLFELVEPLDMFEDSPGLQYTVRLEYPEGALAWLVVDDSSNGSLVLRGVPTNQDASVVVVIVAVNARGERGEVRITVRVVPMEGNQAEALLAMLVLPNGGERRRAECSASAAQTRVRIMQALDEYLAGCDGFLDSWSQAEGSCALQLQVGLAPGCPALSLLAEQSVIDDLQAHLTSALSPELYVATLHVVMAPSTSTSASDTTTAPASSSTSEPVTPTSSAATATTIIVSTTTDDTGVQEPNPPVQTTSSDNSKVVVPVLVTIGIVLGVLGVLLLLFVARRQRGGHGSYDVAGGERAAGHPDSEQVTGIKLDHNFPDCTFADKQYAEDENGDISFAQPLGGRSWSRKHSGKAGASHDTQLEWDVNLHEKAAHDPRTLPVASSVVEPLETRVSMDMDTRALTLIVPEQEPEDDDPFPDWSESGMSLDNRRRSKSGGASSLV